MYLGTGAKRVLGGGGLIECGLFCQLCGRIARKTSSVDECCACLQFQSENPTWYYEKTFTNLLVDTNKCLRFAQAFE